MGEKLIFDFNIWWRQLLHFAPPLMLAPMQA